jgi:hypothetical protein
MKTLAEIQAHWLPASLISAAMPSFVPLSGTSASRKSVKPAQRPRLSRTIRLTSIRRARCCSALPPPAARYTFKCPMQTRP